MSDKPIGFTASDWAGIAAITGVVLVVLYGAKKAASAAVDAVRESAPIKGTANLIADSYLALTLPGQINVRGSAIFPDGSKVPLSQLRWNSSGMFVRGGLTWQFVSSNGADRYVQIVGG